MMVERTLELYKSDDCARGEIQFHLTSGLCEVASRVEEFSGNSENSDLLASNLGNRSATRFPHKLC